MIEKEKPGEVNNKVLIFLTPHNYERYVNGDRLDRMIGRMEIADLTNKIAFARGLAPQNEAYIAPDPNLNENGPKWSYIIFDESQTNL